MIFLVLFSRRHCSQWINYLSPEEQDHPRQWHGRPLSLKKGTRWGKSNLSVFLKDETTKEKFRESWEEMEMKFRSDTSSACGVDTLKELENCLEF